jgi:hypothetical protein
MGWPSSLTYREIAARNVPRSVGILACYGDIETAAAMFATDPALADDPRHWLVRRGMATRRLSACCSVTSPTWPNASPSSRRRAN